MVNGVPAPAAALSGAPRSGTSDQEIGRFDTRWLDLGRGWRCQLFWFNRSWRGNRWRRRCQLFASSLWRCRWWRRRRLDRSPRRAGCTGSAGSRAGRTGGSPRRCSRRAGARSRWHRIGHVVIGDCSSGDGQSRAEKQCVARTHFLANPSRPNRGRAQTPTNDPTKAAANHSQPCRLPVAMPENSAPILQPKESRAP